MSLLAALQRSLLLIRLVLFLASRILLLLFASQRLRALLFGTLGGNGGQFLFGLDHTSMEQHVALEEAVFDFGQLERKPGSDLVEFHGRLVVLEVAARLQRLGQNDLAGFVVFELGVGEIAAEIHQIYGVNINFCWPDLIESV